MATLKLLSFVLSLLFILNLTTSQGLYLGFYSKTCPDAEYIALNVVKQFVYKDPTLAAPLLRMHFHDCFVRGCDGSVLLDSTKKNQAEKAAIPNLTLRGFNVIDAIKSAIEKKCPGVVSCADILSLATRDSVHMIGGAFWEVPTGRRDGRVSRSSEALNEIPSPFDDIYKLKKRFSGKGLNVKDLAVLSGGHTIGIGHCFIIQNRLYNFTGKGDTDPSLDPFYAAQLKKKCKPGNNMKTVVEMDPGSSKTFDKSYYNVVSKRRGLFQSDAALLNDVDTKSYVLSQSYSNNGFTFAHDFAQSMVKMGHIGVLTGKKGEIRKKCSFVN
ncbi:peroxidase 27-like [Euphorbia lathyris]|uniref:peroxidase 27-like n=1 Tax=Euphorbia lathyris TaxID=212925 RepID=UPI003313D85C